MNEQLKFLIELQDLDSSIMSMVENIDVIPRKLDQFKSPLQEANEKFQKAKIKLDALNKKKKVKDMQLDEIQDKIAKLKSKSSGIKTNKEYEAHLKEIQGFEKNISMIEDDILIIMEEIETYEKDLKEEQVKVRKAEDAFNQQEKVLGEEQKKLQAELETEKAKRKDFVLRIDKGIYTQYINLLKRFGDKAVVETRNEICLGCNTNIPPQLFNDIKKNDNLYSCFFCKRFLYFKESPSSDNHDREAHPSS
ncbi:MAG: hypothetical protein HY757_09170 [Nitrospirae bacterium]|nr:hypothetical protein [Nitrospirota bacterium]